MHSRLWFRPYHHYRKRGGAGCTAVVFKFAHWKPLGSFKNYCCLGSILRDSNLIGMNEIWVFGVLKPPQLIRICSKI